MTGERKTVAQICRENLVNNARKLALNCEPHFHRFMTARTKYKIDTLRWTIDGLLREIDKLQNETPVIESEGIKSAVARARKDNESLMHDDGFTAGFDYAMRTMLGEADLLVGKNPLLE